VPRRPFALADCLFGGLPGPRDPGTTRPGTGSLAQRHRQHRLTDAAGSLFFAEVNEIPPIELSYFDPERKEREDHQRHRDR